MSEKYASHPKSKFERVLKIHILILKYRKLKYLYLFVYKIGILMRKRRIANVLYAKCGNNYPKKTIDLKIIVPHKTPNNFILYQSNDSVVYLGYC